MRITITYGRFEWNKAKELRNIKKHGCDFRLAAQSFSDPDGVLAVDEKNSSKENRCFWLGQAGGRVLTVRFTYRKGKVRIIGAGYWRKGRRFYEKENARP